MFTYCLFDATKNKLDCYRGKYCKQKVCYICKKGLSNDDNNKKYQKVKDHCHFTGKYIRAAHDICNLRYKTLKEIPVIFHNDSTYDYPFMIKEFIIKELANEFEGQIEFFGGNRERYITFSLPIKKELDNDKTITNKIKFIDSFRFMSNSLSSLVDNLSEGLHIDNCTDCKSCLDYMDNQLIFRCLECKKNYKKDFNNELNKRFTNIY